MNMTPRERAELCYEGIFGHQKEGYKGGFFDEGAWSSFSVDINQMIDGLAKAITEAEIEAFDRGFKAGQELQ